jgi:RNA polymerase-binding transcription factor DksA
MLDKDKIKEKLEKEKRILLDEMDDIGRFNPKTKDWEAVPESFDYQESDSNDTADRFEDFESRTSTLEVLERRLKDVDDAIKTIDTKSFGLCKVCGGEIEMARIQANSAARTCKKHIEK